MYSDQDAVDPSQFTTAEDLLRAMRKGNTQKLEIGMGAFTFPVRLLSAHEEATIAVKAAQACQRANPTGLKREIFEAQATMIAILTGATLIDNSPSIPPRFFELLTSEELGSLYDAYTTLNKTVNPNVQDMKAEEIAVIVDDIKKKRKVAKDFYTYQLAAVGKYFLQEIIPNLPTDNAPGS
jgi:hypothetical protein